MCPSSFAWIVTNMRVLLTSLLLLLVSGVSSADEAQNHIAALLKNRSQVDFLIGQRIVPEQLPLQPFDIKNQEWGPAAPQPLFTQGGSLFIVNLWSTHCLPCVQELPLLFSVWDQLQKDPALKTSGRLILIADNAMGGNEAKDIRARQQELPLLGKEVPPPGEKVPLFLDGASRWALFIGDQTALGRPPLPSTLLVDRCGVIRHAFVGTLLGRRAAFDTAVRRLATATQGLTCAGEALPKQPETPPLKPPQALTAPSPQPKPEGAPVVQGSGLLPGAPANKPATATSPQATDKGTQTVRPKATKPASQTTEPALQAPKPAVTTAIQKPAKLASVKPARQQGTTIAHTRPKPPANKSKNHGKPTDMAARDKSSAQTPKGQRT